MLAIGLLAGAVALHGCDADPSASSSSTTPAAPGAAAASAPAANSPAAVTSHDSSGTPRAEAAAGAVEPPPQAGSDESISAQVKGKLASDVELRRSDIAVETSQGKVRLSGQVSDTSQIVLAEAKAATVDGVRGVENQLSAK